ncbi:MAG: nickel-responsive transcriptional regulator NikR [Ignisphaera sp.]|nr:nickel-responsive transcriptional regulator NikR [Ignisphaera sp.]MCX8168518.1 nickel-responsive transcriptional regulator NikR [Ignisphaera sp.]MDW8085043.1 nickel-responsive transcriptional regulator NikR [Ignisphaera sp.]
MSDVEKGTGIKFGVYISKDLIEELDKIMLNSGIKNRSKLIQEALRLYIIENKWISLKEVAGSISILYNHSAGDIDEKLTDIQHTFRDIIVSSMHIHLDERTCMLVIAVKGESQRIKEFLINIRKLRGVLLVRHSLLTAQSKAMGIEQGKSVI